ncbi:MAG: hypothetical protein ACLFQV_03255, partial [Vulcanimicrobiota bacterium]
MFDLLIIQLFQPFNSFYSFIFYFILAVFLIGLYTAGLYFALQDKFVKIKDLTEEEMENQGETLDLGLLEQEKELVERSMQIIIILFAIVGALTAFFYIKWGLHSIQVDARGEWIKLAYSDNQWKKLIVDTIIALGVFGICGGWGRFLQILLIEDINQRFQKTIKLVPYLSSFLIVSFMAGIWYFYSNIFPLGWYLFTFTIIYGLIFFFSMKDFSKRIMMHLSQSMEYEEDFSLKTISVIGGVLLVTAIIIFHLIYKTLSTSYILAPFFILWLVSMYMTPGKLFKHIKVFPRYSLKSARLLNFVKYTRKYLLTWMVFIFILGLMLGMGIFFGPGYSNPQKNYQQCQKNVVLLGEAMEEYMIENNNYLPGSEVWKSGEWLQKVKNRKFEFMPNCPSKGEYIYKKWRDEKNRPVYEIICTGSVHKRAGVKGDFPRYNRIEGLVKSSQPEP